MNVVRFFVAVGVAAASAGTAAALGAAEPSSSALASVASTSTAVPSPLPVPEAPPADNDPEPQEFYGRIEIPAIDLDAPLFEGIRLSTLDNGPGHWPGTAMPGDLGNVVVAGHRTSHHADFRHLDELEPGDEIIFDLDAADDDETVATIDPADPYSGVYVYEVTSVFTVPADGTWIVTQTYRHEATLFACHPPGSTTERIVVQADLVSIDGEPAPTPADPPRPVPNESLPEV